MLKSLIPFIPYIIVILGVIWLLYQIKPIVYDWLYWNDYEYIKQRTIELDQQTAKLDAKSTKYTYHFLDLESKK